MTPKAPGRVAAAPATRLSIVVPARNEAAAIEDTLAALQPLRRQGHGLIVVDGGSDDATRSIAIARADRVVVAHRGRASQMNAGAACARGDVLLFVHADTRLPRDAGTAIVRAIAGGHRWGRFDIAIDGRSALLPLIARAMNMRSRLTGIATGDQAIFVTRALFERVGGFPALPLMEDVALSCELKRAGGRPACLRSVAVTSGRRWDAHGALRTILTMWRLRLAFWRGVSAEVLAARYGRPRLPTLQVFARDPVPGTVKTRLAASIGAARAAAVYTTLAERTLAAAAAARAAGYVGDVELWCAPSPDSPAFDDWRTRHGVVLMRQGGGDLGTRMHDALASSLVRGTQAILVGTDCPGIDVDYLRRAAAALTTHDVVTGPADDGGYVLIGLARDADVFSGIRWGTSDVYPATRTRIAALGMRLYEMPPTFDVDTAEDLARFERAEAEPG